RQTIAEQGGVQPIDMRQEEENCQADDADGQFETGVNPERMTARGDEARPGQAPQAHAGHERSQQYSKRNGSGADHELQHLQPDNLVDQRRAAAAGKQDQQEWKKRTRRRMTCLWVEIRFAHGSTSYGKTAIRRRLFLITITCRTGYFHRLPTQLRQPAICREGLTQRKSRGAKSFK